MGEPGDRLPLDRARHARPRAARLPSRRLLLLVHVLAAAAEDAADARLLLEEYRARRAAGDDPVEAWASIQADAALREPYQRQRGKGGFVRASWEEAAELIAAAHVRTIKEHGPDRIVGFTPLPAMSPVSFASGSRFVSLLGGSMLSFYDWYADLPPASPQTFGDQTDVPESADWWNAGYLIVWGTNIPITRTPDAHFMTEARYRGQKVVVVSPDYSDHTTFADDWLPAQPGTDGALAMAMGHVVLREFWVDRETPAFADYARRYTDLPLLVTLEERADGVHVPGRFLLRRRPRLDEQHAAWKPALIDARTRPAGDPQRLRRLPLRRPAPGRWNLDLDGDRAAAERPRDARAGGARAAGALRRRRARPPRRRRHDLRQRACRRGASAAGSVDDRARPAAGQLRRRARRACRATGRATTTTPTTPTRPPGRRRSPASTAAPPRRSRASSPATRRSPAAAR